MKNSFSRVRAHPLISGSIIIFLGSVVSSFINFLFNLFMTRNLSVSDYGAMASLLSITTLLGLITGAFAPTIIKFSGDHFVNKNYTAIKEIYKYVFIAFLTFGLVIFLLSFSLSKEIGQFFNIKEFYLIPLVGILSLFGYLSLINSTFIQAKLSFAFLSFINFLGSVTRLLGGVLFIIFGFGLAGALWANILSIVIPYLVSFLPLKFLFKKHQLQEALHIKDMISYGIPASITLGALSSFITTDIILVKHFFDPHSAGLYSGLSLVGRVIFFFSAPIGTVMFPLIIQKKAKEEKYHTIFWMAIILVFCASVGMSLFYFLFPDFTIRFFIKNSEYLAVSHLLGLFGIFVSVYALLSIVVNYFLSVGKTNIVYPVTLGAVVQILLILFFHHNFSMIIFDSIAVASLLLVSLLLYYLKLEKYDKK